MKTIFMRPWILVAILLSGFSLKGFAQSMYGTGMIGGMQACPYQQEIGDAAEDKIDDIREANEDLKELRSKMSEEKSNKRDIESKLKRSRENLERRAFKSDYLARILDHIEAGRKCDEYEGHQPKPVAAAPAPPAAQAPAKGADARKPQSENAETGTTTVSGDGKHIDPYKDSEWFGGVTCDPAAGGRIMSTACDVQAAQIDKLFDKNTCVTNLKSYQDFKQKLKESEKKLADLEGQEGLLKDKIAGLKSDMRAEARAYQKEKKKEMTEGGCIDCMLQGSGYYYSSNKPNWGGVITNTALGIGSMLLGNNLQKYVANQNARLGYPSQSYPSFGYGFPFIMGAMGAAMGAGGGGGGGFYGAIGGGMGGGAFGCGSGMGGNGYGGMVGGPFGYPAGMFGTPYGGGLFTGYPVGMMAGGMGMFVGGQIMMGGMPMGGYMMGMPMGMMAGGQIMMGGGMPMGMGMPMGGYMMGMPMGMMAGGQIMMGGGMPMGMGMPMGGYMMGMPMGMMAGGQMMMGGGMPMGGYMMGMPMGMMAGGGMMMGMPMGMMGGGGMMMGMPMGMMGGGGMMMGMPMGMQMGSMMGMMGAMGMDSSAMMQMQMQMQQQAMQMQQQQMNAYMQQQQRAQENYMNGSRVISGLYMQLQQAIMSLNTGGYFNFGSAGGSMGVGGSLYQPGMPGGPMMPGQVPGSVPGAIPGSVNPTGPSTSR